MKAALCVLLLAGLVAAAQAGFSASCAYSSDWVYNGKKIEGTSAPLSGCQQSTLGFSTPDNILIGGNGEGSVCGVPAGSGDDGCENNDTCMKWCQAICCMSAGCNYAVLQKNEDTDSSNGGFTSETTKKFYCWMFKSGSLKDSDTKATCSKKSDANCYNVVNEVFGLDQTGYQNIKDLAAYSTCPVARRRLMESTTFKKIPNAKQINASLKAIFKPIQTLKKNANALYKKGKFGSTIQKSGVCSVKS